MDRIVDESPDEIDALENLEINEVNDGADDFVMNDHKTCFFGLCIKPFG